MCPHTAKLLIHGCAPGAVFLAGESAAKTVRGALMQFDNCNNNVAMKPSMVVFRFLASERKVRRSGAREPAGHRTRCASHALPHDA